MKLAKFQIATKDYNDAVALAEGAGVSFSEFVRQALAEKADRQRAIASVNSIRAELSDLLADIRQENVRSRRELSDDATKLMTTSLRKNEELTKTLVMELARSLGGGGKSEPGYGRTDWPDH